MNRKVVLAVAVAALLSACGGGGGGDGAPPPPEAAFNLDAAFANTLTKGISFPNLRANYNGVSFQLSISSTPTTDGVFLSQTYRRAIESSTVAINGQPGPVASSTLYFTLAPVTLVGGMDDSGLTIFTPQGSLPTAASVGSSGPYTRADTYVSDSNRTLLGQTVMSWSLEPDTATTAWACLVYSGMDGFQFEKDCYRIDAVGTIFNAKATMNLTDGTTLTFE
ncbi:MAG: hypothetical protein K0Q43_1970 [Ramlibacter sp.]|jgi:hypothetical protein|nr:hypothetical protein [Ramlibacter sp.]